MRGRIGEQSEYIEDEGGGGGDALSSSIGEGGGGGDALSSSIGSTEFRSRR